MQHMVRDVSRERTTTTQSHFSRHSPLSCSCLELLLLPVAGVHQDLEVLLPLEVVTEPLQRLHLLAAGQVGVLRQAVGDELHEVPDGPGLRAPGLQVVFEEDVAVEGVSGVVQA